MTRPIPATARFDRNAAQTVRAGLANLLSPLRPNCVASSLRHHRARDLGARAPARRKICRSKRSTPLSPPLPLRGFGETAACQDVRVELRVEVGLPPEHLMGDHRLLELAVSPLQVPFDEKSRKPGRPFVSQKAGARQHALERLANRVAPDGSVSTALKEYAASWSVHPVCNPASTP